MGPPRRVLKTLARWYPPYDSGLTIGAFVSFGSLSYVACAFWLAGQPNDDAAALRELAAEADGAVLVQTAAFGAVLLLNVLNLVLGQHTLPFKSNVIMLYVNGLAFVTDLLLLLRATPIYPSPANALRPFAPLRYVSWAHSTPALILMLSLLADSRSSGRSLALALVADEVMVLSGLAAMHGAGVARVVSTLVSFAAFGLLLHCVHNMLASCISGEKRGSLRTLLLLQLVLWSAFPLVWLVAEAGMLSAQAEAAAWGACDFLAKVVFCSQLWQSCLAEVRARREAALEAWEVSNRVQAAERLSALLAEREELVSTLSHELRTPLAGVLALSDSLQHEVASALPSAVPTVGALRAAAACMLSIVAATLDAFVERRRSVDGPIDACAISLRSSRGNACGAAACTPDSLDLRALVEAVTSVLRPLAAEGVAVVADLPPGLPAVAVDATRLSQILYNLLGNALRFTAEGHVRVAARLVTAAAPAAGATEEREAAAGSPSGPAGAAAAEQPGAADTAAAAASGTEVEVCVEDTGVGMPQEQLDALFQPLALAPPLTHRASKRKSGSGRASRSRDRRGGAAAGGVAAASGLPGLACSASLGGTGLGLYLVRLALRARGCELSAESAPGVGSRFKFRLPVAAAATGEAAAPPAAAKSQPQPREASQAPGAALDDARRAAIRPAVEDADSSTSPSTPLRSSRPAGLAALAASLAATGRAASFRGLGGSALEGDLCLPRPRSLPQPPVIPASSADSGGAMDAGVAGSVACLSDVLGSAAGTTSQPPCCTAAEWRSFRHLNGGTLQVLSVDDDKINQLVAGQMLSSQGWKVLRAMDGPDALARLGMPVQPQPPGKGGRGGPPGVLPDCVLLDLMMPGMDGFEVCRTLRTRYPSAVLPIIVVSAKTDAVGSALNAGADDYVTKPLTRVEITARIRAQIRTRDSLASVASSSTAGDAATRATQQPSKQAQGALPEPPPARPSQPAQPQPHAEQQPERKQVQPACCGPAPASAVADSLLSAAATAPVAAAAVGSPPASGEGPAADAVAAHRWPPDLPCAPRTGRRASVNMPLRLGDWQRPLSHGNMSALYQRARPPAAAAFNVGSVGSGGVAYSEVVPMHRLAGPTRTVPGATTAAASSVPVVCLSGAPEGKAEGGAAADTARVVADVSLLLPSPLAVPRDVPRGTPALALPPAVAATADTGEGAGLVAAERAWSEAQQQPAAQLPVPAPAQATGDTWGALPAMPAAAAAAAAATTIAPSILSGSSASGSGGGAGCAAGTLQAAARAGGGEGADATAVALLRELLTEVRRGRALEIELHAAKALIAAMAAERDGWRRQARDFRSLVAGGMGAAITASGGATAGAGASNTGARASGGHIEQAVSSAPGGRNGMAASSAGGGGALCLEALLASRYSRSSGESNRGGAGGGVGTSSEGVSQQLESLKREALQLRQQLDAALGSCNMAAAPTSSGGAGGGGAALSAAASGRGGACARPGRTDGATAASVGAALAMARVPDMLMATPASSVSAISGPGGVPAAASAAADRQTPTTPSPGGRSTPVGTHGRGPPLPSPPPAPPSAAAEGERVDAAQQGPMGGAPEAGAASPALRHTAPTTPRAAPGGASGAGPETRPVAAAGRISGRTTGLSAGELAAKGDAAGGEQPTVNNNNNSESGGRPSSRWQSAGILGLLCGRGTLAETSQASR